MNSKFNIVMPLLLCMSCNSSSNINEKPVKQVASEVANNTVKERKLSYPLDENGLSLYASDKEFHNKDCSRYRVWRSVSGQEHLSKVLPCESDDDFEVAIIDFWRGRDTAKTNYFTGFEESGSKIRYRNEIDLSVWFLDKHRSSSYLSIDGVDTKDVIRIYEMSFFTWNYNTLAWELFSKNIGCNDNTVYISTNKATYGEETSLKCDWYYDAEEDGGKDPSIVPLIIEEEAIKVKVRVGEEYGNSRSFSFVITTPTLRQEMLNAYLAVLKEQGAGL